MRKLVLAFAGATVLTWSSAGLSQFNTPTDPSANSNFVNLMLWQARLQTLQNNSTGLQRAMDIVTELNEWLPSRRDDKYFGELEGYKNSIQQPISNENLKLVDEKYASITHNFRDSYGAPVEIRYTSTTGRGGTAGSADEFLKGSGFPVTAAPQEEVTAFAAAIDKALTVSAEKINSANVACMELTNSISEFSGAQDLSNINNNREKCLGSFGDILAYFKAQSDAVDQVGPIIEKLRGSIDTSIKDTLTEMEDINKKIAALTPGAEKAGENNIGDLNVKVIGYTLIAWGVIIVFVIGAIITITYLTTKAGASVDKSTGNTATGMFLDMMTVFLLTGAILVLGLGDQLDDQGLAALIGGISGYVLGRMGSTSQRQAPT